MTSTEFVVLLVWLLAPPLVLAALGLALAQRVRPRFTLQRGFMAWGLVFVLSAMFAVGIVAFGPRAVGSYLGVRDAPVPWAPFAFVAVALAFPLGFWWARCGSPHTSSNPAFKRTPDGAA